VRRQRPAPARRCRARERSVGVHRGRAPHEVLPLQLVVGGRGVGGVVEGLVGVVGVVAAVGRVVLPRRLRKFVLKMWLGWFGLV
jgi:hypothetical protein